MRQETIIKTYLKFSELTQVQKDKVIEELRNINVDHDSWHEFTTDEFTEKLKSLGYTDIKTYFTGFWSQGDGACFTATHGENKIERYGHYYHEMTMRCDDKNILDESRQLAREYYRDLEKCYDYLTSAESIIETIDANDYEFDSESLALA